MDNYEDENPLFKEDESSREDLSKFLEMIPGFEIKQKIGAGGMGEVYEALEKNLKRIVAIKFIKSSSSNELTRFLQEAKISAQLEHPNVVPIYSCGQIDKLIYINMRYIKGKDLSKKIKEEKDTIDEKVVVEIVCKVAKALEYAHSKNIFHRDVKPSNILLNESSEPFLMDFGLAKEVGTDLTKSGSIMGTPQYMSPEQLETTKRLDLGILGQSDVYSLGATLYELLTGKPVFSGDGGIASLFHKILFEEVIPPSSLRDNVSGEVEKVCMKSINRNLQHRYSNMREFRVSLEEVLGITTKRVSTVDFEDTKDCDIEENQDLRKLFIKFFGNHKNIEQCICDFIIKNRLNAIEDCEKEIEEDKIRQRDFSRSEQPHMIRRIKRNITENENEILEHLDMIKQRMKDLNLN